MNTIIHKIPFAMLQVPTGTVNDPTVVVGEQVAMSRTAFGCDRRTFLRTSPLLGLAFWAGCKKNERSSQSPSARGMLLKKNAAILEAYLARQKVVDVRLVDGICLTELFYMNPPRYGYRGFPPLDIRKLPKEHRSDPYTTLMFVPKRIEQGTGVILKMVRMPTIVKIPSNMIPMIHGTQREQRSFDATLYHEVMGHGADYRDNSALMKLFWELFSHTSKTGDALQKTMESLAPVAEFSAYLVHLEWLIRRFNFDRNPNVVTAVHKRSLDHYLGQHTVHILMAFEAEGKYPMMDIYIREVRKFMKLKLSKVSARTRAYARAVTRKQGWKGHIPF